MRKVSAGLEGFCWVLAMVSKVGRFRTVLDGSGRFHHVHPMLHKDSKGSSGFKVPGPRVPQVRKVPRVFKPSKAPSVAAVKVPNGERMGSKKDSKGLQRFQRCQRVQKGSKGSKKFQKVPKGSKRFEIGPKGSKRFGRAPKGLKNPRVLQNSKGPKHLKNFRVFLEVREVLKVQGLTGPRDQGLQYFQSF